MLSDHVPFGGARVQRDSASMLENKRSADVQIAGESVPTVLSS